MGSIFSTPVNSESHHHRHRHHHNEDDNNELEGTKDETLEIKKTPENKPRKRQQPKVNKAFIPETIDDPAEGDPCGLYVDGVNYHWEREKFAKFLSKNGITFTSAYKKKSQTNATINFDNAQDRAEAYKILINLGEQIGRQLYAVPLQKSREASRKQCDKLMARARSDLDTRDINNKVAPWFDIPYDEQLQRKSEKFTQIISPIIPNQENITVFPAPKLEGYRNKVELTIGRDLEGQICVGYNLGSRVEDVIAPIKSTLNCPEGTPELAEKLRKFIVDSGVPVFDRTTSIGRWKYALIRTNEAHEVMLMIVVYKSISDEAINAFKKAFENEVDSLYYCETNTFESYGKDPKIVHLSGKTVLIETLRGLKFEISPMSFFQTNTPGAELLFQKIEELAGVDENTVLIDVCCGTGVIGLALANKVQFVVGVDIEEQAILDARRNATLNGIQNTEYIAGKAEDEMPQIIEKYAVEGQKVVAIVDPPRGGLHKKALKALRNCETLKRIVYISCNADSLVLNAQKVLFNDRIPETKPFHPTTWFGVDMFPHTDRCEIVMLMQRE